MSSVKILGFAAGTGGLGVLAATYFAASALDLESAGTLGFALTIFVLAGAVALILRSR